MRAIIALVLMTSVAAADDIDDAKRLESQLEYEPALVIVERILVAGGSDSHRYVELEVWAGKLAAGLERVNVAEDHFARALAIEPSTSLPVGTSPKLTAPFDAAKARSSALVVDARVERGTVTLVIERDPLAMVDGIEVVSTGGAHRERGTRIAVGGPVDEIRALDRYGNRLWSKRPATVPAEPHVPLLRRWQLWAGVGTVGLLGGGAAAWRMQAAQDEWDRGKLAGSEYSALREIEARGHRWAIAANVGFGVAAIGGIVAAVAFATRPETQVIVTPSGVGVAGRF